MKIACHTLGCKVNQYDTQAMLEAFEREGYEAVNFSQDADVYLINTCTVTGTGDQKSMKLIRRVHRQHPESAIIVAGCLAQREAQRVMLPGVRLVIGVKRRGEVVSLFRRAMEENACISAVETGGEWAFEPLSVCRHEGKTRATMKIQEGCDRYCAYCIIPYVRGPVRSMGLDQVQAEAQRLSDSGYQEVVITGIHLASYGRGMDCDLLDAIERVQRVEGIKRIRLGSLEPVAVTPEWVERLKTFDKVCPQFHLSMQSGSSGVLKRMHRRYTPEEYLAGARLLQNAFEHCAITTDVLTGFPGETEEEALETEKFLEEVGFARIHVFPYSRRAGTVADRMPDQVPEETKQRRCARLIEIGNKLEKAFVERLVGTSQQVLFETQGEDGLWEGYTTQYARVRAAAAGPGLYRVRLEQAQGTALQGTIEQEEKEMPDCLFCKIARGEIPSTKVYEDEYCYAFRDISPQAPTHILVIPREHMANVLECAQRDDDLLGRLYAAAALIAREEGLAENGFRLVTNCGKDGAQSVGHFHIHVLGGRQLSGEMG